MTEEKSSILFRTDKNSYGGNYETHLLDQYKLFVEMADRVSSRRALSNTFFLTANTVILTGLGLFGRSLPAQGPLTLLATIIILVGAVVFCISWRSILLQYDRLNTAKFEVIHELEMKLPAALYDDEWERLGRGKDPDRYRPLSHVEKRVPQVFTAIYLVLATVWILAALIGA